MLLCLMLLCLSTSSAALALASGTARTAPGGLLQHATELRDAGFTVIPDAGLSAELVSDARAAVSSELSRHHDRLSQLGLDPIESDYAWIEIDKRHRGRYSLRPTQRSAWTKLVQEAVGAAAPVVEALHSLPANGDDGMLPEYTPPWSRALLEAASSLLPPRPAVDQLGAIVSSPGAGAQRFHADAGDTHLRLARLSRRHRLFNVFVPLVDLAEGGDGTMFWPGSHLERKRLGYEAARLDACRSYLLERDAAAMAEMAVPACPAGGLILFDFRLQHRGMPNDSTRERALAHAVLATGGAFDRLGSEEAPSLLAAAEALSADPADRRAQLEAIGRQQSGWWETQQTNSAR